MIEETNLEEITPTIFSHALVGFNTPQTLKIEGYIKKKKVTFLTNFGSTHSFIHYKLAKYFNLFIYLAQEFQLIIADGGTIN